MEATMNDPSTLDPNRQVTRDDPPWSVLVVDPDPVELRETVSVLRSLGYRVSGASRFEVAKRMLASNPPDLLIASVKLGAYNGLHLVVRAHYDHPDMAAILTNQAPDSVLQSEAERQHATYLIKHSNLDLIRVVAGVLEGRGVTSLPSQTNFLKLPSNVSVPSI
jgi:PleD family two-component response regulator